MTPLPTCFKKGTVHIWNQSLFSSLILPLTLIASMSDVFLKFDVAFQEITRLIDKRR